MARGARLPHGSRTLVFSNDASLLVVGMLNGAFCVLDGSSLQLKKEVHDRAENLSRVDFTPDGPSPPPLYHNPPHPSPLGCRVLVRW